MRNTTHFLVLGVAALALAAGCTVKNVEIPALAGPSTFAHSIVLTADRDTLTQNGSDFTDIRVTATGPDGQAENIALRAQVFVDGLAQDFGTLSTKTPITPTTIRYTAPVASTLAAAQTPQTVSIRFTPSSNGDFRSEVARVIDLRLLPQGVILPTNPNLAANFTITPAAPKAFDTVSFDASSSTNTGTACLSLCSYAWDFGDGTSGAGLTVTHEFRSVANVVVTLTVTDARGAQAKKATSLTIAAPTPPTAAFDFTPTVVGMGQDVFFTATQSTAIVPRRLVSYQWTFGDGETGAGVTTSHRYSAPGSYVLILKVTDDVGAFASAQKTLTVSEGLPTVAVTVLPVAPRAGQTVTVNITATPFGSSTIVRYRINWGDGQPVETVTAPTQSHVYGVGQFVVSVTAIDSLGREKTTTQAVIVTP